MTKAAVRQPLTIVFPGTRGEIDARSTLHGMHSSLIVSDGRARVMIDCGADWAGRVEALKRDVILLTHAHADHAFGLKHGPPCPVYATEQTWRALGNIQIADKATIAERQRFRVNEILFEAFSPEHSVRAPAVGYRISRARACLFYAPDVLSVRERHQALFGVHVYIGDGASLTRPIVRKIGEARIGHASVRDQLEWCREEGVERAVFTHCGSQIVKADPAEIEARLHALARERGVEAMIAHDGMRLAVP